MDFSAELWRWEARDEAGWVFASVPEGPSADLRDLAGAMPRAGFGSVRVAVTLAGSSWRTSIFPGRDGTYALPVKKAVRRAEGVDVGDTVPIRIETLDF